MPYFYDVVYSATSNGTTLTESEAMRLLTASQQESAAITGIYGTCRSATAGGAAIRVKTWSTPSTGGTSFTPNARNSRSPAASMTVFTGATTITAGTTAAVRLSIGLAQTGGTGGWLASEPSAAFELLPNGGATGNLDLITIAVATSVPLDLSLEFAEGR